MSDPPITTCRICGTKLLTAEDLRKEHCPYCASMVCNEYDECCPWDD